MGYHHHVQVTAALPHKQYIDQVFCAAINCAQGIFGARNATIENGPLRAQFVLEAAYKATYLSAIQFQRKKLHLTLIGGGVFGNQPEWILDAICKAHAEYATEGSGLQNVYLVMYSERVSPEFSQYLKDRNIPFQVTEYRNGVKHLLESKL